MLPKQCPICNRDKELITHHLSYEPEIKEDVCWNCHIIMHRLSEMSQEQRDAIIGRIDKYGHLWKDGRKKYGKSLHNQNNQKIIQEKYRKDNRDKINITMQEHRFKNLSLDKMIKRIEKMEKQLKIVEKI